MSAVNLHSFVQKLHCLRLTLTQQKSFVARLQIAHFISRVNLHMQRLESSIARSCCACSSQAFMVEGWLLCAVAPAGRLAIREDMPASCCQWTEHICHIAEPNLEFVTRYSIRAFAVFNNALQSRAMREPTSA
jgi:hypothetical protein